LRRYVSKYLVDIELLLYELLSLWGKSWPIFYFFRWICHLPWMQKSRHNTF
jgi:hypothetical protein